MCQRFGQTIGDYLVSGQISEIDFSSNYLISDVVMLDINMICLKVKDGVVGKSNRALIVFSQRDSIGNEFQSSSLECCLIANEINLGLDLGYSYSPL